MILSAPEARMILSAPGARLIRGAPEARLIGVVRVRFDLFRHERG